MKYVNREQTGKKQGKNIDVATARVNLDSAHIITNWR